MRHKRIYGILLLMLVYGMASAQIKIGGNVYGGCEIGKVTGNANVTINGDTVRGSVYGGGVGADDDEMAGLVKGNTYVTMTNGTVEHSIYGGGELGSVGTFTYTTVMAPDTHGNNVEVSMPVTCTSGGLSKVVVSGGSVGLKGSLMPFENHDPDDDNCGWIFCGGSGKADSINHPKAIALAVVDSTRLEISRANNLIPTVITASVYGGCENGLVLGNTSVHISGGQIGTGYQKVGNVNTWDDPYTDQQWTDAIAAVQAGTIGTSYVNPFHECNSWPFGDGNNHYLVYDIFAATNGLEGDSIVGCDGHSFFGNVFGGGSGYYPIAAGIWRRTAGQVNGNTQVDITGGHILTSVYGGNEFTDVLGKSTVNMSGGTVGVPRDSTAIANHPVTCSLYGAGMGDERTWANMWTNVNEAEVNITGGTVFGSVFGGGEEGHVLGDVTVNIEEKYPSTNPSLIGTLGYSYLDGNVFGGGRGFLGTVLMAGSVGGNITVNIKSGKILGSVYGGGRMASVGTYFVSTTNPNYGHQQPDDPEHNEYHGHITVNITGGTIGNTHETYVSHSIGGNVFGGCMGRIKLLNNDENELWPSLASAKQTQVNIIGTNSIDIKGCVYGGPEMGHVHDSAIVVVNNENVSLSKVFGGGYGSTDYTSHDNDSSAFPALLAGRVMGNTLVKIMAGRVEQNVYGGGEIATVGYVKSDGTMVKGKANVIISGGSIGLDSIYATYDPNVPSTLLDHDGHVYGGGQGVLNDISETFKNYCNVNHTKVTVSGGKIWGSVFGGSAEGHVIGHDTVCITTGADIGNKGITGWDGLVFGGGKGNVSSFFPEPAPRGSSIGRVGGSTYVKMDGGTVKGCVYGGGVVGLVGADTDGWYTDFLNGTVYDTVNHGVATVEVSGGSIGNNAHSGLDLLRSVQKNGNVYGGGRGKTDEYREDDMGRVAKSIVNITNNPTIYGSVYGGGQMANIGYWIGYGPGYAEGTSTTVVTIDGSPTIGTAKEFDHDNYAIANPQPIKTVYDTINGMRMISHTCTGNVYGGGQGNIKVDNAGYVVGTEQGHCGKAIVDIKGSPTIMSSVYGGSEEGVVWGNTKVTIAGGTIGTMNIPYDSLEYVSDHWEPVHSDSTYSFGSVYGGSYGADWYRIMNVNNPDPLKVDSINRLAGCVYGNASVAITGGKIRGNVFGGGDMATVIGNCVVVVDAQSTDTIGPLDGTALNAYVFGGGKGFAIDSLNLRKTFANVDSTFVTISGGKICGSVYGGGSDSHVLGSTSVEVHEGANIGYKGVTTWDGNIFGGGRNFFNTNHTNGRVAGNVSVSMDGGSIQGTIFGGGRMALTGIDVNGDPFFDGNPSDHVYDSAYHGLVTINVSGGFIGNSNGTELLCDSDESVGDIFGSGKGDTGEYMDVLAGRVANTIVNVTGSPRIYGSVFGGGEMASIGYWYTDETDPDHPKSPFYARSGSSRVTIGTANSSEDPVIGTDMEFEYGYANGDPSYWTVYGDDGKLIHTCTGNVYGGSQGDVDTLECHWVSMARSRTAKVVINSGHIKSRVFGGAEQGTVAGDTYLIVNGGTIGSEVNTDDDATNTENNYFFGGVYGGGYGSHNPIFNGTHFASDPNEPIINDSTDYISNWTADHLAGRTYGNTRVDILGGEVKSNVFGGAQFAYVGYGDATNSTVINMGSAVKHDYSVRGNVYGANNYNGTVKNNVTVNINAGTLGSSTQQSDVFGGGLGEHTATSGDVTVNIGGAISQSSTASDDPKVYGDIYGGSALGTVNNGSTDKTTVNIRNGAIVKTTTAKSVYGGNVYGGGLGEANVMSGNTIVTNNSAKGQVNGEIVVNVGDSIHQPGVSVSDTALVFGYATIGNNVYGCNNTNGSPQEDVTVNIYGTAHTNGTGGTANNTVDGDAFAIDQVFGGGNLAVDTVDGKTLHVNIFGCDNTIRRVFGGGDAAASPNVNTDIQGGRFDQVFGGGNGEVVPADVHGDVNLAFHGGQVNMFFTGSNQHGEISGTTTVIVDEEGPCQNVNIDEFFAGGNLVDIHHDVHCTIRCGEGYMQFRNVYGGCNQANIYGDIYFTVEGGSFQNVYGGSKGDLASLGVGHTDKPSNINGNIYLTVTGGTIDTIFGGCNINGNVTGIINVTVDDAGNAECPLDVHNVYGGGRGAAYTPTDPNSISPVVSILNGTISKNGVGTLGNVFGGGLAAAVTSNPKVIIGGSATSTDETIVEGNVYGGGDAAQVTGNTHVILDGASKVDIQGNVFGGGHEGEVTGNAKVEVKETTTQP